MMKNYVDAAKKLLRSGKIGSIEAALDLASEAPSNQAEEILDMVAEYDKARRRGAYVKYCKKVYHVDLGGLVGRRN